MSCSIRHPEDCVPDPVVIPIPIPTPEELLEKLRKEAESELTNAGKQFLDEIKEKLSIVDPNELKKEIIKKAEGLCEDYLRSKLDFLPPLGVKGVPRVSLDFDGTTVKFQIDIFVLLADKSDSSFETEWMVKLTINASQNIAKIEVPELNMNIEGNSNYPQDKVDEAKRELEAKKTVLINELIIKVLEDYMPPLRIINEVRKIFG